MNFSRISILFIFLLNFLFIKIESKIRLFTFQYNRTDFIEIQHKCLQKFLKDDYELIVFNDAKDEKMAKEIEAMCNKYQIQCVRFPQHLHNHSSLITEIQKWEKMTNLTGFAQLGELKGKHPSVRHCHVIQYALDNFGYNHDDIVGLLDGDMFLIKEFSIRDALKNYDIIANTRWDDSKTIEYLWVGIAFFNMPKLPNKTSLCFNLSCIDNHVTDSGGHTYYYVLNNPGVRVHKFAHIDIGSLVKLDINKLAKMGYDKKELNFIKNTHYSGEFHFNNHFLHYSRGSFTKEDNPHAFETSAYHKDKTNIFNKFIEDILN